MGVLPIAGFGLAVSGLLDGAPGLAALVLVGLALGIALAERRPRASTRSVPPVRVDRGALGAPPAASAERALVRLALPRILGIAFVCALLDVPVDVWLWSVTQRAPQLEPLVGFAASPFLLIGTLLPVLPGVAGGLDLRGSAGFVLTRMPIRPTSLYAFGLFAGMATIGMAIVTEALVLAAVAPGAIPGLVKHVPFLLTWVLCARGCFVGVPVVRRLDAGAMLAAFGLSIVMLTVPWRLISSVEHPERFGARWDFGLLALAVVLVVYIGASLRPTSRRPARRGGE